MKVKVKAAQSCLFVTPGLHVHEILQARILEWIAFPFSRGSSQPREWTRSPALQVDSLPAELQGKPKNTKVSSLSFPQGNFPAQEPNRGLLHCKWIISQLSYQPEIYYVSKFLSLNHHLNILHLWMLPSTHYFLPGPLKSLFPGCVVVFHRFIALTHAFLLSRMAFLSVTQSSPNTYEIFFTSIKQGYLCV